MCCEDVKIDWQKRGIMNMFKLGTTSQEIIGPDQYRWSLLFLAPAGAGVVSLNCDDPAVTQQGIQIGSSTVAIYIDRDMVGDAIAKPWYGLSSSNGQVLSWIETLLLPGDPCGDPNQP